MLKFVWISLMTTLLTVAASAETSISYSDLPNAKEREVSADFVRQVAFGIELIKDRNFTEKGLQVLADKTSDGDLKAFNNVIGDLQLLQVRELDFEPKSTELLDDGVISLGMHVSVRYIESPAVQGTVELKGRMNVKLTNGGVTFEGLEFDDSYWLEASGRKLGLLSAYDGEFAAAVASPMIKAHFSDVETLKALLEADYDEQDPLP